MPYVTVLSRVVMRFSWSIFFRLSLVQDRKWPAEPATLKSAAFTQSWERPPNSKFLGTAAQRALPPPEWPRFFVHQGPVIGLVLELRKKLEVKHCLLEICNFPKCVHAKPAFICWVLSSVCIMSCLNFAQQSPNKSPCSQSHMVPKHICSNIRIHLLKASPIMSSLWLETLQQLPMAKRNHQHDLVSLSGSAPWWRPKTLL